MLKVKLSIPGQSPHSKLDKFIGRTDNNVDNCKFYINMILKILIIGLFLKMYKK